jgi:hypothetical protein
VSAGLGGYVHHAVLHHDARLSFLTHGEHGDEGFDQAIGTKIGLRTIL